MNYHKYYNIDVVNGPGTRCSLFVAGCVHQCKGCYNKSTWNINSGFLFTPEIEDRIVTDLNDTVIKRQGLSLSGGDPLHPDNCEAILHLVKRVKTECKGKDIWLWTGYCFNEFNVFQKKIIKYIDVIIDGKFEQEKKDSKLLWRGSANQRIIYLN